MDVNVESINLFPIPLYRTILTGMSDELELEKIVRDKLEVTTGLQGIRNYPQGIHHASALQTKADLIGINNRDLSNMTVDLSTTGRIISSHTKSVCFAICNYLILSPIFLEV